MAESEGGFRRGVGGNFSSVWAGCLKSPSSFLQIKSPPPRNRSPLLVTQESPPGCDSGEQDGYPGGLTGLLRLPRSPGDRLGGPSSRSSGEGEEEPDRMEKRKELWQVRPRAGSRTRRWPPLAKPSPVPPVVGAPGDSGPGRPKLKRGSAAVQELWVLGQNPSPP